MITMSFDTVMDRKVERDVHYISPGGYELRFANGQTARFDFQDSVGSISTDDHKVVCWEVYNFDECYEQCTETYLAEQLKLNGVEGSRWEEFYVHTGEYDDPEITCLAIRNLTLEIGTDVYRFPDFELNDDYTPKAALEGNDNV